jgi:hypothetical protein
MNFKQWYEGTLAKYKVQLKYKEGKKWITDAAGAQLILMATSEADARKQAKEYLKNTYPTAGWGISYVLPMIGGEHEL